jgi:hypothetical protein
MSFDRAFMKMACSLRSKGAVIKYAVNLEMAENKITYIHFSIRTETSVNSHKTPQTVDFENCNRWCAYEPWKLCK